VKPRRGWEKEIAFTNRCLCLFYIYDTLLPYNQQKIFYNYFTFKSRNYTEYNLQIKIMSKKGIGPRGLGVSPLKQTTSNVTYSQDGNHFSESFDSDGPSTVQGSTDDNNFYSYTVNRDNKGNIKSGVLEDGNANEVLKGKNAKAKLNTLKTNK